MKFNVRDFKDIVTLKDWRYINSLTQGKYVLDYYRASPKVTHPTDSLCASRDLSFSLQCNQFLNVLTVGGFSVRAYLLLLLLLLLLWFNYWHSSL
jgi:hypothetical protein